MQYKITDDKKGNYQSVETEIIINENNPMNSYNIFISAYGENKSESLENLKSALEDVVDQLNNIEI